MDDPLAKEEAIHFHYISYKTILSLHTTYYYYYIHDFDARELKERMQEPGTSSENSGVVSKEFSWVRQSL